MHWLRSYRTDQPRVDTRVSAGGQREATVLSGAAAQELLKAVISVIRRAHVASAQRNGQSLDIHIVEPRHPHPMCIMYLSEAPLSAASCLRSATFALASVSSLVKTCVLMLAVATVHVLCQCPAQD